MRLTVLSYLFVLSVTYCFSQQKALQIVTQMPVLLDENGSWQYWTDTCHVIAFGGLVICIENARTMIQHKQKEYGWENIVRPVYYIFYRNSNCGLVYDGAKPPAQVFLDSFVNNKLGGSFKPVVQAILNDSMKFTWDTLQHKQQVVVKATRKYAADSRYLDTAWITFAADSSNTAAVPLKQRLLLEGRMEEMVLKWNAYNDTIVKMQVQEKICRLEIKNVDDPLNYNKLAMRFRKDFSTSVPCKTLYK
jgi:hypothetical protein